MPTYQQRFGHAPHPQIVTPPKRGSVARNLARPAPEVQSMQFGQKGPRVYTATAKSQTVRQPFNPDAHRKQVRQQAIALHKQAQQLYLTGKRKEALALNAHARGLMGLDPTGYRTGIVGGVIQDFAKGAEKFAYNAPGLPIVVGKAVGSDAADVGGALGHTLGSPKAHGNYSLKHSRALAKNLAVGTYETGRHPLRDPFSTALLVGGAASAVVGGASRLASASDALSSGEGVGAALARPGYRGGSLLRRKPAGEINLPGGAQALEHDNQLLNVLPVFGKRARMRRVVKAVEQGKAPTPLLPKRIGKELSGQSVVGRENRAREQVLADVENARRVPAEQASRKLTSAEHDALRTRYVEGSHALRHPEETIRRHIATHERWAAEAEAKAAKVEAVLESKGKTWKPSSVARAQERIAIERNNAAHNLEIAKDLPKALEVLKNPRPEFHAAHDIARRFQLAEEKQLQREGTLSGRAAYESRATLAEAYGRSKGVAPKGSTYFPTGPQFKYPVSGAKGGPVSRVASSFGLGKPQASRYLGGTMKHRTGESARYGVVQRPIEAQTRRAAGVARGRSVDRSYNALKSLATKHRKSELDYEIRAGGITPEMRQRVAADAEHAASGNQTALGRLADVLKPLPGEKSLFVDSRYLKEFASSARGIEGASAFNKPFRFGGVYARPAYVVTNRPQNFIMRHLAQSLTHSPGKRGITHTAKTMRAEEGVDVSSFVDALGGDSRTESFLPSHWVGKSERAVTQWIMDRTDKNERYLAVKARGAEKGVISPEDWAKLRSGVQRGDEAAVNKAVAIGRRARKDMVDFATTPGERTLSDIIYFYPWLSRGSIWSGRFLAEHPIKATALAQGGEEMKREGIGPGGPVPAWMKGQISTRFGFTNLNPLNSFSTPAQIVDSARSGNPIGEEFGAPATQLLTTKVSQLKQRAVASVAPLSFAQRAGWIGSPSKSFPNTGLLPAAGKFVVGGPFPQKADRAELARQATAEMTPEQRLQQTRATQLTHLQNLVKAGELPRQKIPEMRKALEVYNQRQLTNSKISKATSPGTDREKQKMVALLSLLHSNGLLSTEKQKEYQRYYTTKPLSAKDIQDDRAWFWRTTAGPTISWYHNKAGG